jgi:predicted RNase H-like HicB family nuclease
LEIAVVTQGRSLDETLANLRSALELHLDDEELALAGLAPSPRLVVSYETSAFAS